jgi:hypothetical protein
MFRFAVLMLIFLLPTQAWCAPTSTYQVLGPGGVSCGQYVETRRNPDAQPIALADVDWIEGYLTAYNEYNWPSGDLTRGTDSDGLTVWVDNYCAANPLDDLAKAARALTKELRSRAN